MTAPISASRDTGESGPLVLGPSPLDPALLKKRSPRPTPRQKRWPDLEIEQILAWADAHYARSGQWPTADSGFVAEAPREKWANVNAALRFGLRGLSPGSSLARLLAEYRGVRNRKGLPPYREEQILAWADAHYARTGKWPTGDSGPIAEAPGETWTAVAVALAKGIRGLPGGSSLAQLLAQHRQVRNRASVPLLTETQILAWADAHHVRTGHWPTSEAGPIADAPGETWTAVENALKKGGRGLPSGSSLAQLLEKQRRVPNRLNLPRLTVPQILHWARAHHERTGRWPVSTSGPIADAPGERWSAIHTCLRQGNRGLPGGITLARLLAEECGARRQGKPVRVLTEAQILAWLDAYHERTGRWPSRDAGPIAEVPGETWTGVDQALKKGGRGLPGGSSLACFLAEHRQVQRRESGRGERPPLTETQILAWADAYYDRAGRWPDRNSGAIDRTGGETWQRVDKALRNGRRGLPGGSSLAQLLAAHRGWRMTRSDRPPLTEEQIALWADAHYARTGEWPTHKSGPIEGAPGETWSAMHSCLEHGYRGLPGGSSLARLLAKHRGVRNPQALPELTARQILAWADAFRARHGHWPYVRSGPIEDAPGETWLAVEGALRNGCRGLPGGSSLHRLIKKHRPI